MKRLLIVLMLCSACFGLTKEELTAEIDKDPNFTVLKDADWEAKIQSRGVARLFDYRITDVMKQYVEKITIGREVLADNPTKDEVLYWTAKIARMKDKYAACKK